MKTPAVKTRTILLVEGAPAGVRSRDIAAALAVSWATASSTLARLYWDGRIDRARQGGAFVYTPRPARERHAAA